MITPRALFAVAVLPLSKSQLESFCVLQRKMIRRIIGWRRIADEAWRDTMIRMDGRMSLAMDIFPIQSWKECIHRARWRLACHIAQTSGSSWMKCMVHLSKSPIHDMLHGYVPQRSRGRPRIRWDDSLRSFCEEYLISPNHWVESVIPFCNDVYIEDAFCAYCSDS